MCIRDSCYDSVRLLQDKSRSGDVITAEAVSGVDDCVERPGGDVANIVSNAPENPHLSALFELDESARNVRHAIGVSGNNGLIARYFPCYERRLIEEGSLAPFGCIHICLLYTSDAADEEGS